MKYLIRYSKSLDRSKLKKYPLNDRQRLQGAIVEKLETLPHIFGKPLQQSLRGYWSLRVGPYRIIYRISDTTVDILDIGHRSEIYE